jgi:hypothetical protein
MRSAVYALAVGLLSACSTVPDVEYSYYLAKSNTNVSVSQTVACNDAQTSLIVAATPTVATSYSADYAKGIYKINIGELRGSFAAFADSDANFTFYDDGRLKGINQTTTGQGETIVKSAAGLLTAVAPLASRFAARAEGAAPPLASECKIIQQWGAGKPISLSYTGDFDLEKLQDSVQKLTVSPGSQALFDALKGGGLPPLYFRIKKAAAIGDRARYLSEANNQGFVPLSLQEIAVVEASVESGSAPIWKANIIVPTSHIYTLPIPKAAFFGKQGFLLSLSEAGAITAIDYSNTSGAAGALNAGTSIATAVAPETAAAKAADLKARADVIAQQQRLMGCQLAPASCK